MSDPIKTTEPEPKEISFDELYQKNPKGFEDFVEKNEEVKKYFTSKIDKAVTKGIETWKVNHLDKIIEDEKKKVLEENDPNKPWLKDIAKLQEENRIKDEIAKRAVLKANMAAYVNEVKLDLAGKVSIDELLQGDDEKTKDYIDRLRMLQADWEEKGKKSFVASTSYTPQTGTSNTGLPFDGDIKKYEAALKAGTIKFDAKIDDEFNKIKYKKNR